MPAGQSATACAPFVCRLQLAQHVEPKIEGASKIIVHCRFCQQRGPRCADQLLKYLESKPRHPPIEVLRGGFVEFGRCVSV